MEQILEVNKIQSFPAKNDSFESSTEYEQINSVLGNLLANTGRVKSKEVPDARNRVSSLINSMMIIMNLIDPLFSSMKPESSERGSAKNRLKVFKPNEFDYDVILTLPIDEEEDKIVEPKDGCVKVMKYFYCLNYRAKVSHQRILEANMKVITLTDKFN